VGHELRKRGAACCTHTHRLKSLLLTGGHLADEHVWGVIDGRMDVGFVERVARSMARGTVLFVGPQAAPDPRLWQLPRVASLPPLPFARLPALAREAAVLVMPYADLPVTRAMQPLKLKEYLATGRPVVVRDLPATRDWGDCLDLAADADGFARLVNERLGGAVPAGQAAARRRLDGEGWEEKARAFARWALPGAVGATG
jgi:glycosyltransferase involved in cell wall biosynthesis